MAADDKEGKVRSLADIIKGAGRKPKKARGDDRLLASMDAEDSRIKHIAALIKKPSKSIMESGNLPDLKRELTQLKSKSTELARKILLVQESIKRIEENRNRMKAEIDGLKAQEERLEGVLITQRQGELSIREQLDILERQKQEEEITLGEQDKEYRSIKSEYGKLQKQVKSVKTRLTKAKNKVRRMPDKILKAERTVNDNLNQIAEYERKLSMMDKELATTKLTLESAIGQQRAISKEYDRVTAEKGNIEAVYAIYADADRLVREKEGQRKSIIESKKAISGNKKAIKSLEGEKEKLTAKLARVNDKQKHTKQEIDSKTSKLREIQTKFDIYRELDTAAREFDEIEKKISENLKELAAKANQLKETSQGMADAKNELQKIIEKEGQLKKKLNEVLAEKQKLEEELQDISDLYPKEKLIIELPGVLREAIKKETDNISHAQEKIEQMKKTEEELREGILHDKDADEELRKQVKAKEKHLLYIKNKLGSAGYSEQERQSLKKQLDRITLEQKEFEGKMNAYDLDAKHIKSLIVKVERHKKMVHGEIEGLREEIEKAKSSLVAKDEEMKSNRERKVKAWAGTLSLMRLLYPLKSEMDRIFDEKTKIRAELDEAGRVQARVESQLDEAEQYVGKCRDDVSGLEEEYVGLQTKIHALEKQNSEARIIRESITRQLREQEECIPLIEAEFSSHSTGLQELKGQMAEFSKLKKHNRKNLRGIESNIGRVRRKLNALTGQINDTEERLGQLGERVGGLSDDMGGENTKIIQALDEKQALERQLTEYKRQQSIVESEINIIAGIYK
jgi:chromosome segregation ATPase